MFIPNLHSHTEKQSGEASHHRNRGENKNFKAGVAGDSLSRKAFMLSLVGKKYLESQRGKFKPIVVSHPCTAGQSWCEASVDGWCPLTLFLHCPIIQPSFKKELNKVRGDIVVYFIRPGRHVFYSREDTDGGFLNNLAALHFLCQTIHPPSVPPPLRLF